MLPGLINKIKSSFWLLSVTLLLAAFFAAGIFAVFIAFQGAGIGLVVPEFFIRTVRTTGIGGVGVGTLRAVVLRVVFPFFSAGAVAFAARFVFTARIIGTARYRSFVLSGLLTAYAYAFAGAIVFGLAISSWLKKDSSPKLRIHWVYATRR